MHEKVWVTWKLKKCMLNYEHHLKLDIKNNFASSGNHYFFLLICAAPSLLFFVSTNANLYGLY